MRKTTNFRDVVKEFPAMSILLALFTLVFTFTACSSDDDDDNSTPSEETLSSGDSSDSGTYRGHEYVDLGLSVKWATCNVGASSPEDYGNYYAWGETKTKSSYTSSNSVTYEVEMSDISGNTTYDAATANWGGSWRMPTYEEMAELIANCTRTWTTQNDVNGYLFMGSNGNSIFLPAAGLYGGSYGTSLVDAGYGCKYWSSTPSDNNTSHARCLNGNKSYFSLFSDCRYYGRTVRPVISSEALSDSEEDDTSDGSSTSSYEKPDIGFYDFTATTTSLKVQYKIYNKDEAKVSSAKIYYGTSSNPSSYKTATVSGVLITANISGLKSGTTYYVKCVATGKGGTTTTSTTKCITNF